jgi:predicted O-linked N-acetylglucosamine transferase (SPINDLY family)
MTPKVVELWARIVRKCEGSRLFLKAGPLADAGVVEKVKKQFADQGIDPSRLLLEGRTPGQQGHLARYADIDIALDPFPYSGTTTTCEALLMGVPVVALSGDRHASRVSASLLKRIGLDSLVATTPKQYQQIALELALPAKRAKLAERRAGLRNTLLNSPLCDKTRYAREVEAAYRSLWRSFCRPTSQQ